jgi:hypothetical protein
MSFFKGLSKVVKKNVNFKTLVKVAGKASSLIPGVGGQVSEVVSGMQQAHQEKKAGRQAEAQALVEQAAQTAGNALGSNAGKFISKTAKVAYDTAGNEVKEGAGKVGASVVDSTIKEWFKKHWWHVLAVIAGLLFIFKLLPRLFSGKGGKSRVSYQGR